VQNVLNLSYSISDRRAEAVKEECVIVESNSHLHAQRRYTLEARRQILATMKAASVFRNTRCDFKLTD